MKIVFVILGSLVGIIVVGVGVLFALGHRDGARTIAATVEIARPADEVLPWLRDPERTKQWVSWLIEVQDQNPEVSGVGHREVWLMDDPNMNEIMALNNEVIELDDRHIVVKVSADGMFTGESAYTLTDLGNGRTRLSNELHFEYEQWIASLFEPVVTPAAQKKLEADLARLVELAEAESVVDHSATAEVETAHP